MGEIFIILILIFLIGLLTGMFSGNKIAAIFADALANAGLKPGLASGLSQTIIILIVTYLSIVIGEHVPDPGEQVEWGCFRFEVVDMDGPRIDKVIVKKILE